MNKQSTVITRWKRFLGSCFLCVGTLLILEACVPTMMVGGGVAGSMAATDRRTLGSQT